LPGRAAQAAASQQAVSKALLISGMFMPKLEFAAFFERLGRLLRDVLGHFRRPLP
jgi:hypothetical protein